MQIDDQTRMKHVADYMKIMNREELIYGSVNMF